MRIKISKAAKIIVFLFVFNFIWISYYNHKLCSSANEREKEYNYSLSDYVRTLFPQKSIANYGPLYDLSDELFAIYVEFYEGGYCILSETGGVILEYSLNGNGPFYNVATKMYYCGPTYYYVKTSENHYYNYYDKKVYSFTDLEIILINEEISSFMEFLNNSVFSHKLNCSHDTMLTDYNDKTVYESKGAPTLDEQGIILSDSPYMSNTTYIDNYNYFLSNPMHGVNSTGTCGAIAAQLLLTYHNYYSDRRILDAIFLNGGWNNNMGDYDVNNPLNYLYPERNPNSCNNPDTMNWYTLGSNGINETDNGTFFNYLVDKIPSGATTSQVQNGINSMLSERNEVLTDDISYSVSSEHSILFLPINGSYIRSEIDYDRPTIVLMHENLGGWNHYVVVYGYQDFTSPIDNNTYSGYISHFGDSDQYSPYGLNVWINSAWCYSFISLQINHTHTYVATSNYFNNNEDVEIRCTTCGHRTLTNIYNVLGNEIVGFNFQISGNITIPSTIDGVTITSIGDEAFKNRTNITNVSIPSTVTSIGDSAFRGCTSLESITIPSSVESIGDDAFRFCSSLSEVIVLKDTIPITALGEYAFDDCDSHLEIKVPINRVADYKANAYWSSYSNRIVPNIPITSTIDIDCLTEDDVEIQLNANESKYYKLVIDCGKSYQFVADDSNDITITIYNSNMALIYSNSENNNNNTLTGFLSPGIYYLKIEYASIYDYGLFTLEYSPTYLITNSALVFGTNNIQNNIHLFNNNKKHGYFSYSHTLGEGFFKFSLNGGYNNNYPANAITIYTNNNKTNALARYPINNSINAISNINENELYVYIPSNGTYYIDLLLYASNSLNTTFTISNLDISIMDYTNNLQFLSFNFVFEEQDTFSYFKEVSISHKSKMQIDINSLGTTSDDIPIYLYKREIEPGNDPGNIHYIYTLISNTSWRITSNTYSPLYTIVLDAGTYYLGYSNNINHIDITIALRRVVDYDASSLGTLITDPALNQGYTLGSEVNFNGGLLQDTTITEGFTRCIYLMFGNFIELPDSRLDYDWYSSNDSVASVTHYGTVLGKPVNTNTNVRIYAVLKEDPSVVFIIELTILDDTETDEIEIISNLSYSYSTENGIYQLALDNSNSPYPWINYYIWAIDIANDYPNLEVEMNQWGYITSNGTGEAIITANYHLNPRVYLTIYLMIY